MEEKLSDYIKNQREKLGISQRELARRIDIDNASISYIEKGRIKKPSIDVLVKISKELNLNIFKLIKMAGYEELEKMLYMNQLDEILEQGILNKVEKSVINKVISTKDNIPFLDIKKILKEYKNNNINEMDTIKLITVCSPIDTDDSLIYRCENEDIILEIDNY